MKSAILAALALALAAGQSLGATAGQLEAQQPWSRPAVAGTTGAGYMVIANNGKAADVLQSVESPLAARVEIHRMSMAGGVMSMARVATVAVPAGGRVAFAPGGYHLMLLNLKRTLKAGDDVPATLVFASGARVPVRFRVGAGVGPPQAGVPAVSMPGMKP
jgi:copper(I)-binding protein